MTKHAMPNDVPLSPERSGLENLVRIINGESPAPAIWAVMGHRMIHAAHGTVTLRGIPGPDHTNLVGTTHGGWYATLLDSALGGAVNSTGKAGEHSLTLELKVNIIRPIPVGMEVEAVGEVDHAGRRTGVAHARITGVEDGKIYATASTTMLTIS